MISAQHFDRQRGDRADQCKDPQHAGTLNVSYAQSLSFNPATDPTSNPGSLDATGDTLDILGPLPGGSEPATIDNGTTLELATPDGGAVRFAGATGRLDNSSASGKSPDSCWGRHRFPGRGVRCRQQAGLHA
jgi:hypothetical protein